MGRLVVLLVLLLLGMHATTTQGMNFIPTPKDKCDLNRASIPCWTHLDEVFNKQCDESDTRFALTQRTSLKTLAFLTASQRLDYIRDTLYSLLDVRFGAQMALSPDDPSILVHGVDELHTQVLLTEQVSKVFAVTFDAYNENYPTMPLHFTAGKLDKAIIIAKHYSPLLNRREYKVWQAFKTCITPLHWNWSPNGTELYSTFSGVMDDCQMSAFLDSLDSVVAQHNAGHFLHHVDWKVLQYRDDQDEAAERYKDELLKKTDWAVQQDTFEQQHDDAIFRDIFVHKAATKTKIWRGLHFFINFASVPYDEVACQALSNPQWL